MKVGLMANSSWFTVDVVPVHFTFQFGLRFGLELVWGWLEIYLGLICGLLRIGSRLRDNLFGGGFRLYFKIGGALLRVSLSFYFRLVRFFFKSRFNVLWLI